MTARVRDPLRRPHATRVVLTLAAIPILCPGEALPQGHGDAGAHPPTIVWQREHSVRELFSYEAPEGSEAGASGTPTNSVMLYAGDRDRRFNLVILTGPLFTVPWWQTQLGPDALLTVRDLRVCGAAAQLTEYHESGPASSPVGSIARPQTVVALFAEASSTRFEAQWIVASVDRALYREAEEHFFASFRCPL